LGQAFVLAEDLAPASNYVGLVKDDVGLVIGDQEDFEQPQELTVRPLGLLFLTEVEFVRVRVQRLDTVVKEDDAED